MNEAPVAVAPAAWTQLGTVSTAERAAVDARGRVTAGSRRWSLDWWVGADDRWHLPHREVGVRQRRIDGVPVVETSMKVPGGDAVHRAYAAQSAAGPVVVVEVENRTSVPFAVALVVVPEVLGAPGEVRRIVCAGEVVEVDGAPALHLPRPAARVAGGSLADAERVVVDGVAEAPASDRHVLVERNGDASAAVLYPLAHRATLRVVLSMGEPAAVAPTTVPDADDVVRGWRAQLDRGPTVVVPDDRYRNALDAARSDLLLFHAGPDVWLWPDRPVPWTVAAPVVEALDRYGLRLEAEELLQGVADEQRLDGGIVSVGGELGANGAVLWALGRHWQLHRDDALIEELVGPIAKAGHWIEKRRRSRRRPLLRAAAADDLAWSVRGLEAIAPALDAIGQPEVAEDLLSFAARLRDDGVSADVPDLTIEAAVAALDRVSGTRAPDPAATATYAAAVRDLLVREDADGLALASVVPHTWLGQSWEVQGMPTRFGRLGYAVRWHGERPALLWELEPFDAPVPVTLRAPGLDPAWSTTAIRGETLLAAVPPPGDRPGVAGGAGASSSFT